MMLLDNNMKTYLFKLTKEIAQQSISMTS